MAHYSLRIDKYDTIVETVIDEAVPLSVGFSDEVHIKVPLKVVQPFTEIHPSTPSWDRTGYLVFF